MGSTKRNKLLGKVVKAAVDADATVREQATDMLRQGLPKSLAQLKAVKSDDAEVTARVDGLLRAYWDLQALEHFRKAYELRLDQDLRSGGGLREGDAQIAAEAALDGLATFAFPAEESGMSTSERMSGFPSFPSESLMAPSFVDTSPTVTFLAERSAWSTFMSNPGTFTIGPAP